MRMIGWKWLKAREVGPTVTNKMAALSNPSSQALSCLWRHSNFTSSSVFLLLKNQCGSAISWWIGRCLIIHQVLKREIPWVPVYVRVVLLLFTPCQKYNQTSRELGSQAIVLIIYGLIPYSTRNPKLKIHCLYSQSIKNREEIRS